MASVAVLGFPGSAIAQEPRDTTAADTARRIEPVVIQGVRTPAAVGGSSVVVVQPDSLRTSPAPLLEEALRATPFVLVRQNSRGEIELSVRGSDSRQAAVLLDGVPLTLGWDHRTDPSLVPLSGVQSMVVVRGLSTLLQGPNVLGGVIDLGLARGAVASVARRQVWAGTGIDQYGARAFSVGGALPITAGRRGSLMLRAGGGYRQRDGFRVTAAANDTTAEDGLRTNSDLRHVDGFAALRWQGTLGSYLGIATTGYQSERGVPPELHVQDPRLWRYPDQSRVLVALSAGTGLVETPFGSATLELSGGYNAGKVEIESFADRRYTTLDGRERGDERTATGRVSITHSLPRAGQLRAAVTSGDVRYEETLGSAPPNDYRQRLWSAGAEAQWLVLGRALVAGGVVYDGATTPETGGREPLGKVDAWGWRAGMTVFAGDPVRVHLSASRRSRFPALRELYSGAIDRFQPNPNLQPERLTGGELGVTLGADARSAGGFAFQAVGFLHRLDDAVVRTTVPNTTLFVRVNRDEIRSAGAELLGSWQSSADPARAVSLTGDLLTQRVRVHDDSANAERRPEHQPEARGTLELGFPLPALIRAFAGVRYTGTQFCVHPDLQRQVRLGGHTEGTLAVERSWPLGRAGAFGALRTVLALDNATDATIYDQCGLPQPGRTLRIAIQLR